jgi:hypothetical protein
MKWIKKTQAFFGLPIGLTWLFIKALFVSAVVKTTLAFLPFSKVTRWMGAANKESSFDAQPEHAKYIHWVRRAVELCNRYSFWETECYTQALTAKILLRRKKIPATLYIGFHKDKTGKFKGHAWLRSGEIIVTGKKSMHEFQVHSFFS